MKSKKLLISLAVVAFVIVFIVVMIAVFAVDSVEVQYHDFNGDRVVVPSQGDGIVPDQILSLVKGKSTVFLSKANLIEEINKTYKEWHAFAVVKRFPNSVEVHFVKRTAIAKVNVGGKDKYIDSFGYVVAQPTDGTTCIDISSAFDNNTISDAMTYDEGERLTFVDGSKNAIRLKAVLDAILSTWRCMVEIDDIDQILGEQNVFRFDSDDNLIIRPITGGSIKVIAPETNLSDRLIKAYSVYYNANLNLQNDKWEITVHKNGSITTPSN